MAINSKKIIWSTVVALAVAGGGYWGYAKFFGGDTPVAKADALDRTYTVKRGELVLGVSGSGSVNSRQKHKIRMEANLSTKLLNVVDENTHVKKGEFLAEMDAETLKNDIEDAEIELDNLEKELDILLQNQNIQISTDAESLRTANDRLEVAEDALRKYRRYELRESRDSFDTAITDAGTALTTAQSEYDEYLEEMSSTSSSDSTAYAAMELELEAKATAITTAENAVETAESNRKVFLRYDNPTKIKSLESEVAQAQLNLEKVKVSINSTKAQQQREIDNMRKRIRRNSDTLTQQQSYLPMMTITAPASGVVLYGDVDARWGRVEVKTGMDVYRGMVLLTIPDMENLVVDFDLPEIYRSKVSEGNRIIITPDSLQGVKFEGELERIETLPVNWVVWDSNSPKIYKCKVHLNNPDERLVNGMKVQLQIVTGIIEDAITVPVESVFEEGDRFFVYKSTASGVKEQDVSLGRSNDTFVEITEGLKEDEVVYLYRPFQKREGEK